LNELTTVVAEVAGDLGDLDATVDGARDDDSLYEAACGDFRRNSCAAGESGMLNKTGGFYCNCGLVC